MKLRRGVYAAAGTIMLLFLGSLYAWSYFKVALGAAFPMWTQTQLTLTFTIMMIAFCLGGLLGGKLSARIPRRFLAMAAGGLLLIGFLVLSYLPKDDPAAALGLLYGFYGVGSGLGVGIGFNVVLAGVNGWFPDKSGLISGVLLMGFGLGSLVLGNLADWLIRLWGLFPTFRFLGIVSAAVLFCGSFFLVPPQGDLPPVPKKSVVSGAQERTTAQMLRRPSFWIYFVWNICMSATGLLVINNASSISVSFGAAATVGLLVSVCNGGGRLPIGLSMDRLGWKATMLLVNGVVLASGGLMYLGNLWGLFPLVLTGMLLAGVCYGGGVTIQASLVRSFYGSQHYAVNFSTCNLCAIPASILGPMLSAALLDAAHGAFGTTFAMVIVLGCVALVANLCLRRP